MRRIDYKSYFDKVYGCFQGKCIAGTIGAPYEGMKQVLDIKYSPDLFKSMLPNDDLDLQVLWLEVLERKGIHFTSEDLAKAFKNQCPYSPGEYAIFKKNYSRGLYPPVSGWFNNRYYMEGMGCPIRSEIWACLAPGNTSIASQLAEKDGIQDHSGNSVYAEQFLAALEAEAFFEDDIERLIQKGLEQIPENSRFFRLVSDVRQWCSQFDNWEKVLSKIIQNYGHPDCTNLFQNMGIVIMAFILGKKNFIDTTMLALNCGFDTDCTCATVGAMLGIILGAERMRLEYGYEDQRYVLGVDVKRRSDSIYDFSEDVANMGLHFADKLNLTTKIEGFNGKIILPSEENKPELTISVEYDGVPAIGIGDEKKISIKLVNNTDSNIKGVLNVQVPEGWKISIYQSELFVGSRGNSLVEAVVSVPAAMELLNETNILNVEIVTDENRYMYSFGIVGASVWNVYGPFWENIVAIGSLAEGESYIDHIKGANTDDTIDKIRHYHLNTFVDLEKEYIDIRKLASGNSALNEAIQTLSSTVNIYEDKFSINDIIGFQGPCLIYMTRDIISPDDRDVIIHIGHTDAFEVWINGSLISRKTNIDWWTAENVHIGRGHLNKGINRIVLKLARRTEKADFSIAFLRTDGGICGVLPFPEHYTDFTSIVKER